MRHFNWYAVSEARFPAEKEWLSGDKPVNRLEPLVSVCVPTFQQAAFIRECLDGVLMQVTTFPFEIIVGEDESTDGTRDICVEYATRHPDKIRLFLRSRARSVYARGGATKHFNGRWCFQSTRGKYVAFCEGDDCWTDPAKLQTQVDLLESRPDVSLCGHRVTIGAERGGDELPIIPDPRPLISTLTDVVIHNWVPTCSIVVRRESLPRHPPAWARHLPMGDWPLQVTAAQRGKIAFLNTVMGFYRWHPGGVWSSLSTNARMEGELLFYKALRGQVPGSCWATVVRPKIATMSMHLSTEYRHSGDWRLAGKAAWGAMLADPVKVMPQLSGILLRAYVRNPVLRAGRMIRSRLWHHQ